MGITDITVTRGITDITVTRGITDILPSITATAVITAMTGICPLRRVPRMGWGCVPLPCTTLRPLRERGLCLAILAFRLGLDFPSWHRRRSSTVQSMRVATGRMAAGENPWNRPATN